MSTVQWSRGPERARAEARMEGAVLSQALLKS